MSELTSSSPFVMRQAIGGAADPRTGTDTVAATDSMATALDGLDGCTLRQPILLAWTNFFSARPDFSLLLYEPLFAKHPGRSAEALEYIQSMPDRISEPLFERGHEDVIRHPIGGIGG